MSLQALILLKYVHVQLHRSQSTAVLNSQVPLKGPNISVGEMKRINNGQNHGSGRQRSKSEGLLARRCVDLSSGQYPSLSLNRPIAGGNFLDTSLTQRPDKTLRLQKSWEYQASFDAIWPVTDPVTLTFLAMQVAKALYISSPFLKQTGANNPSPHYNNPMSPLQSLPANFPLSTPRPDHTFLSQSLPATIINKPSLSSKESIPTPGPFPGPEMPTLAVDAPLTRRGSTGEGFESSPNWNDGEGRINLERFEYGAENTHSAVSRSIINAERVDIEKHATFSQPLTPSNSSSRTSSIMEFDSLDRLDTPFEVHLDYLAISTSPSGDAFDALPPSSPRPSNSYLESHDIPKSPRQLQQSRPRLSFTFPFFVPSKRTLPCHIGNDSRMQPEAQKVRHSSIRASRDSARIVNTGIASNRDQNLKVESG